MGLSFAVRGATDDRVYHFFSSFINFPFFIKPERKAKILKIESTIRMRHELQVNYYFHYRYLTNK